MAALGLRAPAQTGPAVTAILQSINRDSVTRLNFDLYLDGGLVIPQNEDIRYEVTRTSDSTSRVEFKLVWLRTPWDVDQSQMLFSRQVVLVDTGTFGVETHIFLDTFMDETIYYAPRHYHPVYYPSGVIERMASGDSLPRPQFKVTNSMGEWTYPLYDNALYGGVMGDNATIAAYIYHIYPEGTQVTIGPLGTMPDNFIGWSDCDDTMQVRTITLTQDTHIVALFDEVPPVCGRPRDL